MIQFILFFASTMFLTSFFINGWYNITRGQWVTDHTGKKEWKGKIFSFWGKLLQTHESKFENFTGAEFLKEFDKVSPFFTNPNTEILDIGSNAVWVRKMEQKKLSMFFKYALSKGVLINQEIQTDSKLGDRMLISIFKEVKEYKLPNFLRAPLGECLACMSSVYGTIMWIFWYKIAEHFKDTLAPEYLTAFFEMPLLSKAGLWIFFCISLAYLNEVIFSINHKLQRQ